MTNQEKIEKLEKYIQAIIPSDEHYNEWGNPQRDACVKELAELLVEMFDSK